MSEVAAGPPPGAPPEPQVGPLRSRRRLSAISGPYNIVMEAGRIGQFAGHVLSDAVRRPRGYWKSVRDESYLLVKLCWWPMVISTFAFGFGAPGIQGVNVFALLGVPDRLGSFFVVVSVREFGPFVTAIVVAGVVGSAYTSDLGSRRIREEIDAMEVLGVDATRELVLPRIIACTLMTGLLDVLALTVGIAGGLAASTLYGANYAAFLSNLFASSTTIDLAGGFVKTLLFGLIIAVVCCYKGLNARGGPIGVGRAVNQAVVIAFVAIFVVDYVYTATMLGLFPEIQVYR
jgi:phospholipid/cholesterol/gamma-HCH transport system permease protein